MLSMFFIYLLIICDHLYVLWKNIHSVLLPIFFFQNSWFIAVEIHWACTIVPISPYYHQHSSLPDFCFHLFHVQPNGHEVITHCSFYLYFPNDQWCWSSFYVLTDHSYIYFGEMYIQILSPCFNSVVWVLSLMNCRSTFYVPNKSLIK